MTEKYTFLCSAVVIDKYDHVLFEETILLASAASSEEEAKDIVSQKLEEIETICNMELNKKLFLSVHCPFFMPSFYVIDDFNQTTVFECFSYLKTIRKKSRRKKTAKE